MKGFFVVCGEWPRGNLKLVSDLKLCRLCPNGELTDPNHEQRTEEKTIVLELVTTVRGKVTVLGTMTWSGRQDPLLLPQQLVRR